MQWKNCKFATHIEITEFAIAYYRAPKFTRKDTVVVVVRPVTMIKKNLVQIQRRRHAVMSRTA